MNNSHNDADNLSDAQWVADDLKAEGQEHAAETMEDLIEEVRRLREMYIIRTVEITSAITARDDAEAKYDDLLCTHTAFREEADRELESEKDVVRGLGESYDELRAKLAEAEVQLKTTYDHHYAQIAELEALREVERAARSSGIRLSKPLQSALAAVDALRKDSK